MTSRLRTTWTDSDHEQLRQLYAQGKSDTEIATITGRAPKAIKSRRKLLRLVSDRLFTPEQIEVVRTNYHAMEAPQIAAMIGKRTASVYRIAKRLGLANKIRFYTPAEITTVRQLNLDGLNDYEIADMMGMTREQVHHIRYDRLKLDAAEEGLRRGQRRALEGQRRVMGIKSIGQLRSLAFKNYAIRHGLPEGLRPRAVQIVYALASMGPSTHQQIAMAIGMPWKGARKSLVSNDPEGTYLSHLESRGIVVCLKRKLRTGGRGQNVSLYDLTLEWRERITSHVTKNASAS